MAPSSVELESVHNMDGQRKVQFEKVLPLLKSETASKGKHYHKVQLFFSGCVTGIKHHLVDLKEEPRTQSVLLVVTLSST